MSAHIDDEKFMTGRLPSQTGKMMRFNALLARASPRHASESLFPRSGDVFEPFYRDKHRERPP
jgi:hypothetical protein